MKRLAEQTLYEILEIRREAPADEVEMAYERAKLLYGPGSLATYTLMDPDDAALLSRRVEEARAVLLDPVMRAGYDAGLAPESQREIAHARPLPPVVPPVRAPAPRSEAVSQPAPSPAVAPPAAAADLPAAIASPESGIAAEGSPALAAEVPAAAGEPSQASPVPPARPEPVRPASQPLPAYSIPEGGAWTGEVLRRVREARGFTLRQISERTKVTRHHLENIEADRYGKLPAPVYLRGILMSLAKELRLDGQKVARSYLEQAAAAQALPPPVPKAR